MTPEEFSYKLNKSVSICDMPNAVTTTAINDGLMFTWSRKNFGFGNIIMTVKDGNLHVDTECMDAHFCAVVIEEAIEEAMNSQRGK